MSLNWRNNPIRKLHGSKGADSPPNYADWLIWVEGTKRAMGSVGVSYIYNMIKNIEWDGEDTLTFLSESTPPELIHDPSTVAYKTQIVQLAAKAGKHFADANPTVDDQHTLANYNIVEIEITSFGGQVFDNAKEHFATVFTDASRKDMPMKPLIEWNIIQRLINPKAASDPTKAWNELSRLVQLQPTLTESWLTDWISQISKHRSDLLVNRGSDTVDSLIIPNVISRIKNVQVDMTIIDNLNWKLEAANWHRDYQRNPNAITWETLKANIILQIGDNKNLLSTPEPNVGAQRPRLHPAAPQGMALAADVELGERFQAAVQAATEAATASALSAIRAESTQEMSPSFTPPANDQIKCHTCGGIGHISRVCPSNQSAAPNPNAYGGSPLQPRLSRHVRGGFGQRGGRGGRGTHFHPYARGGYARGGAPPQQSGRPPAGNFNGGRGTSISTQGGRGFHRGGMASQPTAPPFRDQTRPEPPAPGFGMMGYEPYFDHDNYEQAYYDPAPDQHYQEFEEHGLYGEQAYYGAEIGMTEHIPGLHGRAAQMGQQFHDQVWGQGRNFGLPDNDAPDKIADPSSHPTALSAALATNMQTETHDNIRRISPTFRARYNPFANILLLTQMLICCTNIGAGVASLGTPRTRSAVLTTVIMLLFCISIFPNSTHAIAAPNATFALLGDDHPVLTSTNSFGLSSTTLTAYLIDSGCSTSIITDSKHLHNIRPMIPVSIAGLSGYKTLYLKADLHLPVRTAAGHEHSIVIHNVFYDPEGHFNLVSSDQLNASRYDVMLTADPTYRCLHFIDEAVDQSRYIPITKVGKLYQIPTFPPVYHDHASFIGQVGSMSLEELFHLRMAHTPLRKLAVMSHQVAGMPRHLQVRESLRLPCDICQEAKIVKPNAPPASNSVSQNEDDLVTWDLIDMGEKHPTVSHNRYLSLFVIHRSRYAIAILHQNRKDFKSVLMRAITKMGFTPKIMRSDGAAEYLDADLEQFFIERGIQHQVSNPHQQFQNAISEKFVDSLGKGIRTLLLQSQLPPEFWGCAAHYFVDIYNHLPHDGIHQAIPYAVHHQVQPDVSWFRPFGCKTTIYQGKDLVEHGKLAPRGEQGVFIGLGISHGRKCWLAWAPRLNRIYASRHLTFDETLFPLRDCDQRVYGVYDNHTVQQMRADVYNAPLTTSSVTEIINMPIPPVPTSSTVNINPLLDVSSTQADDDTTLSQQPTQPMYNSDDELNEPPSTTPCSTSKHGGGTDNASPAPPHDVTSLHRGGDPASSHRGGTRPPFTNTQCVIPAASASAGEVRPPKRARFHEAPPQLGTKPKKWWDCEMSPINTTSDEDLAEFLIGHSLTITFPQDYWPRDNGNWVGQAFDTAVDKKHFPGRICLKVLLTSGPKARRFGEHAIIPLSKMDGTQDVSIRRALREQSPNAIVCRDLTGSISHPSKTVDKAARQTRAQTRNAQFNARHGKHRGKGHGLLRIADSERLESALLTFATLSMLESHQTEFGFISEFELLEPKSQREARASAQCQEWITAEKIELKTIWDMGTFEIVDTPTHVLPLPSRFTYRIKRNKDGTISKYKARLVARGDMQTEDEYSTTFAPTSRFTAIRTIISLATQEQMTLKHWDITGAFMTADIDTEIYLELPPGYELPEGKSIKLKKSLYGLR